MFCFNTINNKATSRIRDKIIKSVMNERRSSSHIGEQGTALFAAIYFVLTKYKLLVQIATLYVKYAHVVLAMILKVNASSRLTLLRDISSRELRT